MKTIDIHTHLLKKFYDDLETEIKEVLEENKFVINIGFNLISSIEIIETNKKYENVLACIGIHPDDCNESISNDLKELEKLMIANKEKIVAIGEIGLDYYRDHDKIKQKENFIHQIKLAEKYNFPIIIHSRESLEDVYEIVKEYPNIKFLLHSWSGDSFLTKKYLDLKNIWFSFNGVLTFKNGKNQQESIKQVPINKIFLETDSPYLTPVPFRGKKNSSKYVKYVYQEASKILGININTLMEQIEKNIKEFFKL